MKRLNIACVSLLCIVLQLAWASAQTVSQSDVDAIAFPFASALTILQGSVLSGKISSDAAGESFVTAGLVGHDDIKDALKDYYLSGYATVYNGDKYAVLLLCDQESGHALLEGVICKSSRVVEPFWKATPLRPCARAIDVAAVCQ